MLTALLIAAQLQATSPIGERTEPITIQVEHNSEGDAGDQLVYLMQDAFRKSATFRVTSETPTFKLVVATLEVPSTTTSPMLLWSISITFDQSHIRSVGAYPTGFVTSAVGMCDPRRLRECADDLYVATATEVSLAQRDVDAVIQQSVTEYLSGVNRQAGQPRPE